MEILTWYEFFKLNPFDDYHRFYRPAALVAHSMPVWSGSRPELDDLLGWLEKRPAPDINAVEQGMLKALGIKPPPKG